MLFSVALTTLLSTFFSEETANWVDKHQLQNYKYIHINSYVIADAIKFTFNFFIHSNEEVVPEEYKTNNGEHID